MSPLLHARPVSPPWMARTPPLAIDRSARSFSGRTAHVNPKAGWILLALALRLGFPCVQAAAPAAIEDARYPDDTGARAAWEPMRGTEPVSVATPAGRRALRMPCAFARTNVERASWDRKVNLDLASAQGVQFQILCRDATPVSYFSLYFQSGEGWYHGSFFPESSSGWNTITLDKAAMSIEGRPAGWGRIGTIRISAWRGRGDDTEFFLTDLRPTGVLGADAVVAIIRAESAAQHSPEEARSVTQYAEAMAEQLQKLDLGCAVVGDLDVTAARLKPAKVALLPYNPSMPDPVADELVKYVQAGGKLVAFYSVPDKLRKVLGIEGGEHLRAPRPGFFSALSLATNLLAGAPPLVRQQSWNINACQPVPNAGWVVARWLDDQGQPNGHPAILGSTNGFVMTHVLLADDSSNKRRLLLAMLGSLAPDLWRQAVEASLARIGTVGGFATLDELSEFLMRTSGMAPRVAEALTAARRLSESARKLAAGRQFANALEQATTANRRTLDAYCLAQQPLPGEFRAFWCHSAFGVEGMTWDDAIRRLAENGFTAILPNMLWGGVAFYDSKVLPVASSVKERGDQIAQCLAASRKHGVQVHVWKVNWNLGHAVPRDFVDRLRQEGRLQANAQGTEEPWLCPSHPENQQLEIASLVEVARVYEVDGIHFDYIRYPDAEHCFCGGCQKRFPAFAGATLQSWPQDVLPGGSLRRQWLDWRRGNITAVVKAVSEQARAVRPKIKISAAVFPNWAADRDSIGQDWKLWCDRGYLDFVCPMDYTPSNRRFDGMVGQQVGWAGRVPCYPGIGYSASSSHFGADRAIEQINLTRRHRTKGFVIFNYGVPESQELLPLLGMGITARRP